MIRLVIKGEVPAKKNSRIVLKNGRNIPSKRYQEWHAEAEAQVLKQKVLLSEVPVKKEVIVSIEFIHGDLRRRDSDNGTSSVLDLLCDTGILTDDNWQIVRKLQITNTYEKNNPMCIIAVQSLEGGAL